MTDRDRPLAAVNTEVGISADRVHMGADVDASVSVSTPRHGRPLCTDLPHATITASGEGVRVSLELTADQLEALAGDLRQARAEMGLSDDADDGPNEVGSAPGRGGDDDE
jgi:hypothetical protein